MKVVIIIPTYNEKGNIEKIIPLIEEQIFPKIKNYDMHILVADDNSPDGTGEEVKKLMKKWKNIDISSGEKKGLGAAYIRGMTYAVDKMNADILFEMDADFQHPPEKIPQFLKKIENGYDMVIGNRYSDGGSIPENWPLQRKAYSIIANIFVRTVFFTFAIHDWTGGYRALKKEVFLKEKEKLTNYRGYIFQISFLHKAVRDGFKIGEVPFHFSDRTLGDSKIASFDYISDVVRYVLIARIKELKRFIKFLLVGGTGFIIQLTAQEGSIATGIAHTIALVLHPSVHTLLPTDIKNLTDSVGAGIGAEFSILSNYMWNNFWTFEDTRHVKHNSNFFGRLLKFNFFSCASILIQFSAVFIAERTFGLYADILGYTIPVRILILFPAIILFVIPLNYLIYNKIIWKTQYLKHEKNPQK